MEPRSRPMSGFVDTEEGEETRKALDDTGAVGFLTLINQPRTDNKKPLQLSGGNGGSSNGGGVPSRDTTPRAPTQNQLRQYADDLAAAGSGLAQLRNLNYTHDLVQAFFPNPRQTKLAKEADAILRNLLQVPLPAKAGTLAVRRLPSKSTSASSVAKTLAAAFAPVVEALDVLGSWQAIFFAFALVQEAPMEPAELDKLRAAAQALVDQETKPDAHAAIAGLLQFLALHEVDPFGLLVGHAVNPFLCALDWAGSDAVCQPSPTRLQWGGGNNSSSGMNQLAAAAGGGVSPASSAPTSPVLFKRRPSSIKDVKSRSQSTDGLSGSTLAASNGATSAADTRTGDSSDVLARIHEWADLKSDTEVAEAVRSYAAMLRHSLSTIKPGDLVLVCWRTASDRDHSRVYFGRFVCFIDSKTVGVYMDALENDTWQVPNHLVAALPRSLSNPISVSHTQMNSRDESWRRLLATVIDARETATMAGFEVLVTQQLDRYLSDTAAIYGLDFAEFKRRMAAREISVADLPLLKQVGRLVDDADQSGMQNWWMAELRQLMDAHAVKTMASTNVRQIFLPHRRDIVLMLASASEHAEPLMHKAIAKVQALVESANKGIQTAVDEVKGGHRKKALITWWLELTRTSMMNLLVKLGYAENATSYDYINDPPLDYRGVQRNLQVLRRVLEDINAQRRSEQTSPTRTPPTASALTASAPVFGTGGRLARTREQEPVDDADTGVCAVIESIKDQVYPRIQEYVSNCIVILCDALRIPVESFSHETCKKLYESRAGTLGEAEKRGLASLLDDVDYLTEMQRLENNPREKSMHIVPISGLCVGRVVRLESEMRTVVEVWGNKFGGPRRADSFADEVDDDSSYSSSSAAVVIPDDFDMATMRQRALELVRNVKVEDRWYRMVCYKECWIGSEAVDYFVRAAGASSRMNATTLCANLLVLGLIEPVMAGMPFVDGWEFYRFPAQLLQDHVMDELLLP